MSNRPAMVGLRPRITDKPPPHWPNRACRDEDPELFFPLPREANYGGAAEKAKSVCRRCPVGAECLQWALGSPTALHGVWGGTTEEERAALIRSRPERKAA